METEIYQTDDISRIISFLQEQGIRGEDRFLAILNAIKKHFPLNSNQKPQYNL